MRRKSAPSKTASARTSSVFAVPGTPSISAWPCANSATSEAKIKSSWPTMTLCRPLCKRSATSEAEADIASELLSQRFGQLRRANQLGRRRPFVAAQAIEFAGSLGGLRPGRALYLRGHGPQAFVLAQSEVCGDLPQRNVGEVA